MQRARPYAVVGACRAIKSQRDQAGLVLHLLQKRLKTMSFHFRGKQDWPVTEPFADHPDHSSAKRIHGNHDSVPPLCQREQRQILSMPENRQHLMAFGNIAVQFVELFCILAKKRAPHPQHRDECSGNNADTDRVCNSPPPLSHPDPLCRLRPAGWHPLRHGQNSQEYPSLWQSSAGYGAKGYWSRQPGSAFPR